VSTPPTPQPERELTRGVIVALLAMGLAVFVIANDVTALSVALPDIEKDFNADVSTVQWVINAYALIFGVLIVTGGRLADMFGRKRIFFIGSGVFALFSLTGGLAQSVEWLIVSRALMGIGGAMMWPAVLGMTYAALPEDKAGLAGGLIIGAAGFGNAAGPLLGGFITDTFGWEWVLFLNLPIAAIACLATWKAIHQPEDAVRERIDYAGITTLSVSLIALLVALDQAPDFGWGDPRTIGLFALFVVLLAMFAVIEGRAGSRALIPRDVIANREFRAACVAVLLLSATFFAALLYLPQFMQKILGYSPLQAGAGLLPMMATFAIVSFAAGPLYNRVGAKLVIAAGAACLTAGMVLLSLIQPDSGYTAMVPGMVVLGVGIGLFYSAITTAGVTALDPSRSSLAGGIIYMFQIAGGSVGLGLTTTVFITTSQNKFKSDAAGAALTSADRNAVEGVLSGTDSAQQVIARFSSKVADQLVEIVRDAFVHGMQWGFRFDAILAAGGFVVATLFVGGRLRRGGGEVPAGAAADAAAGPAAPESAA
jgi:EmrB/QacA subfamily drug resistance transporter